MVLTKDVMIFNINIITSAFCIKYETLLLSSSIAILSNPINKFIRYTTIRKEKKTIKITRVGLSLYDHIDKALESPIKYFIQVICQIKFKKRKK